MIINNLGGMSKIEELIVGREVVDQMGNANIILGHLSSYHTQLFMLNIFRIQELKSDAGLLRRSDDFS